MSDPDCDWLYDELAEVNEVLVETRAELAAEKARGDRLEKALRAIANDDDEEFVTPVQIIRETARAALGDSNG